MEPSAVLPVEPPPAHADPGSGRVPPRWPAGARRPGRWHDGYRDAGTAIPGLLVAAMIAALATGLGRLVPLLGGPVFGIIGGIAAGSVLRRTCPPGGIERLRPGMRAAGKRLLQASIVLLGTGYSLRDVLRVGGRSIPVMLFTLTVALVGAWWVGRRLNVHREASLLIGVGTGICGASAIAAVTAVVGAAEARVAYALGTIVTFNIVAVLAFPPLGHLLGLSQQAFGLWSGTAVNDTSSVLAAAYSYGTEAGSYAVVVKLTRSLMIIPICAVLQARRNRRRPGGAPGGTGGSVWRAVPLFTVGFLATSTAATLGGIPASWQPVLALLSTFLITMALAGIGWSLEFAQIRDAGPRPLLLGGILWVGVSAAGLGLQAATGQL